MVTYQHSHVSFETDYIGLFMTVIVWCITSKYVCKKIEKNQQLWDHRTQQCMISQTSVKLPTVRECFPWYDNFVFSFFYTKGISRVHHFLAFNKLELCTIIQFIVLLRWCCLASLVVKFVQCFVCVLKKFHHKTCRLTNNDKVYKYSFTIPKAVHSLIEIEILPTTLHHL